MKAAESLGYWTLPKPEINQKAWSRIPRVARTTPFGYEVDEEDDNFLLPIDNELELLEKAKQHLIQYSYREVANWLSKFTDRYISHIGLMKRVKREQRRKNKARTLRVWAKYAEKAIQAAQKLEKERSGSRA